MICIFKQLLKVCVVIVIVAVAVPRHVVSGMPAGNAARVGRALLALKLSTLFI